jgi:DNA repair exonuclease SbcCD nuclease subunit
VTEASTNGHEAALIVAHTSDLHIGGRWHGGSELPALKAVLEAAVEAQALVLILAGDVFDTNRVPLDTVDRVAAMLSDAKLESVFLPGNHDPATLDAVCRMQALADVPNVSVIGVDVPDTVTFDAIGLEIWGTAHMDYTDMSPLASPKARASQWRIAVAHGHYVRGPHDHHRSWLIHDDEINATGADYVALGHWDLAQPVGDGTVRAYYSGSPDLAKTINVVRLASSGVDVRRHPLHLGE